MNHTDERFEAEHLDAHISTRQSGKTSEPIQDSIVDEATLSNELLRLAESLMPQRDFDRQLLRQLELHRLLLTRRRPFARRSRFSTNGHHPRWTISRMRWVGVSGIIIFAVIAVTLLSPNMQAFAQDLIAFFTRAEGDTLTIQITNTAPTPIAQATTSVGNESVPTPTSVVNSESLTQDSSILDSNYPLTLNEAESQSEFDVLTPSYLPEGFVFRGAQFEKEGQSVSQYFVFVLRDEQMLTPQFTIIQQPEQFDGLVGPSAVIEPVLIGAIQGEYVAGGWLYNPSGTTVEADGTVVQRFTWERTTVPVQTLRWANNGDYFQIASIASDAHAGYLNEEQLVAIAASMH